jgi:AMP phosphorylase
VPRGHAGVSRELASQMGIASGNAVLVRPMARPSSVRLVRKKLQGHALDAPEMTEVIRDISRGRLTSVELAFWAAAIEARGMNLDETVSCAQAMADHGQRLTWGDLAPIDIHSIGGVPGNNHTPIVVSIAAAAGLKVPKTSSRAISSACGTADFMEAICPVNLTVEELQAITRKTGAVLAWGGGTGLAPADDEIIRVEHSLGLDPPPQTVASVLGKKLAAGVAKVLIDIPFGAGCKAVDQQAAQAMADLFVQVGQRLSIEVHCQLTDGGRPMGQAIGPILQAREVLQVLEAGKGPQLLVAKACLLAGRLLEIGGAAKLGAGRAMAERLLRDGSAHKKFLEIISAQGAKPGIDSKGLDPGAYRLEAVATRDGAFVADKESLVAIARAAGAPRSKGAGVLLVADIGHPIRMGDVAFKVYAETAALLANAKAELMDRMQFECRPAH